MFNVHQDSLIEGHGFGYNHTGSKQGLCNISDQKEDVSPARTASEENSHIFKKNLLNHTIQKLSEDETSFY